MIIQPWNLKQYSRCPQKSKLTWDIPKSELALRQQLIADTIKTIYLYAERKERVPSWKKVPGWVDRLIRQQPESAEELYSDYKDILTALNKWFHRDYLSSPAGGLANVPVVAHIPDFYTVYGQIDIISTDENALYFFTDETDVPAIFQYNDIEMFSLFWMAERYLGVKIETCVKLTISPRTVKEKRYNITDETRRRVHDSLTHLLKGITNNIFYPSVSDSCMSCAYRYRCSI